jgi:hypothetical protein
VTLLPKRYIEDKALRDAAKAVLDSDLAHFKASLAEQGIVGRVSGQITGKVKRRLSAGARDVMEQAKSAAEDHRGVLAALVGALLLWFAREPLLGLLGLDSSDEPDEPAAEDMMDESQGAEP